MLTFSAALYIFGVYSAFCYGAAADVLLCIFVLHPSVGELTAVDKAKIVLAAAAAPLVVPAIAVYVLAVGRISFSAPARKTLAKFRFFV